MDRKSRDTEMKSIYEYKVCNRYERNAWSISLIIIMEEMYELVITMVRLVGEMKRNELKSMAS